MGYSGTDHYLCVNGHLYSIDAVHNMYDEDAMSPTCTQCGQEWILTFSQDQTNGEDPKYPYTMPPELEILMPEKVEICSHGHGHVIEEVRYKLPAANRLWRAY